MSETITLPPLKKYVVFCARISFLTLCVLCFLWFVCNQQWSTLVLVGVAINFYFFFSFLASMACHHQNSRLLPRTISVNEGILYVNYADPIYANRCGFQEVYLLSEFVWYRGYIDHVVFASYGFCFLPIYFKRGIVLYHKPTSTQMICGYTQESFNQWSRVLSDANSTAKRNGHRPD